MRCSKEDGIMKTKKITSNRRWEIGGNIVMAAISILAVIPFLLLVIASLTDEGAALRNGYSFLPEAWSLDAYKYLIQNGAGIGHAYLISIIVTVVGTLLGMTITSCLGYVLSRKGLPGRRILLFAVTFTMLFNGGACATYIIYSQLIHVKDTIWGLVLPGLLMNGFSIMMFRNYFENSIPNALLEAAMIDGASEFTTFSRIVVPLSRPMFATIGLTQALAYWNDWTNALYYISGNRNDLMSIQSYLNTVNENIRFLMSNSTVATGVDMASFPSTTVRMAIAVVGVLPILCAYPFLQKWFVRGITVGAVKE